MYFLINEKDNSVNCVSTKPFPDFMVHQGIYRKELPVDHLPEDIELEDCFYDPTEDTIIPNALGLVRMEQQEFAEYINQQQLIAASITSAETEKYQKLLIHLASLFPNDPTIKEILSDSVVTQDELQQIEDMLNNQ
jgi:hypothetical protein